LSEAKADPEGVVILEGDYGGQIYVVVQAEQVLCSQKTLSWLLHDLDRISWPGSYDDSARIVFERSRPAPRWQGEWVAASQHATRGFTPNWFGWDSTTRSARFCAARLTASRRSVEQSDGLDGLHCAGKQKSAGSHVSAVVSLANCQHALRLHHIVIDAHDLRALARFWTEALGWKVLSERRGEIVIGTDDNAPVGICFMPVAEGKRREVRTVVG
jgi:hypothetical protein